MYRSDHVQRTNQKPLPIFEILYLESNSSKSLSKCFLHPSSVAYCIFEHRRKDYRCVTSHLLHSHMLVQSTRIPNCCRARTGPWHCRPTGQHPRTRLSASGKFLAATVLAHQTQILQISTAEQSRTPRALRMQLSGCRMTAYRMTAPSAPQVLHTQSFQSSDQQPRWL